MVETYVTLSIRTGEKIENYVDSIYMGEVPHRDDLMVYKKVMYKVVQRIWEWTRGGPGTMHSDAKAKVTLILEANEGSATDGS